MRDIYFIAKINNIYLLFFHFTLKSWPITHPNTSKSTWSVKIFAKKLLIFDHSTFWISQVINHLISTLIFIPAYYPHFFCSAVLSKLTPRLSGGPTALKSIFRETSFSNQLHDFSLLSWNSFLPSFLESKFTEKNPDSLGVEFMNQALIEIFYFAANCFPISEKMFETRALTSFN